MRTWLSMALFLFASGVLAEEPAKATVVVLRFEGERVTFVAKSEEKGMVTLQRGTPQLEPMFFEVRGEEGEVLFAGVIIDPRFPPQEGIDERTGKMSGGPPPEGPANTHLRFPAFKNAKTFTAFRRKQTKGEDDGDRELLVEVGL